jgi:hypothetical protein
MDISSPQVLPAPPSIPKSLLAGFDAVSNHIGLVLFAFLLDLFLWLGPKFPLDHFFASLLAQTSEVANTFQLEEAVKRLNLFTALRSYPIGVPSLMASRNPLVSPLNNVSWKIPSLEVVIGLWLLFTLSGLVIGTLYFIMIFEAAFGRSPFSFQVIQRWPKTFVQFLLLALVWVGILLGVGVPFICLLSLLGMAGLSIGLLLMIPYFLLLTWFLLPLVFSPHGILVKNYKAWKAIQESARLVRFTLPATGMFIFVVIILSEGLDALWKIPAEASWLSIVGILGHAFVNASLLAASFIYYQQTDQWLKKAMQQANFLASRRSK